MTDTENKNKGLSLSAKSFVTALAVIFALMVVAYVLTFVIPAGAYDRVKNADGDLEVVKDSYHPIEKDFKFYQWILSPFLVLGAEGSGLLIAIIAFLLVIGGIFNALGEHGLMKYMLAKITHKYGEKRYALLFVIPFFFMAMGAAIGSFEECVPLVPIVVALAVSLGWDAVTGVAMSLLAVGCGFASGVCNPFTVGVAQELAGLQMFSGIWLRLLAFVLIYALLEVFLFLHAKKVEKPIAQTLTDDFEENPEMDRGLLVFASVVGTGILIVLSSSFLTFLQDYTMVIVAVMFLIAGVAATLVSGMKPKALAKSFLNGALGICPAVIMILMASSIKYTLETAGVLDTILKGAVDVAGGIHPGFIILFIYLIVLVMNFFIGSGSAKALMLIPLIVPLAQQFGIEPQLCIVAFAFGDGFSNVFYPTNAALLIALGLADVSYGDWVKWSWKFQLANLFLTSALLLFGYAVNYH